MKKKIVTIGGGNGSAKTLRALKTYINEFEISGVVSMSDSGGSSGRIRKEFGVLPPGDIMRAILALSPYDYQILRDIFYKPRFEDAGKLNGHNLGNMFLTLAQQYAGDQRDALVALHQAVGAVGQVYPVTVLESDLAVDLESGERIVGEHEIDRPETEGRDRIVGAWLEPKVDIYEYAKKALEEADVIVLGPGSLYCSIIATLLVDGVKEAIAASKATLIYVAGDAYEREGEAGPQVLSEFVGELEEYLPRKLDHILISNPTLTEEQHAIYDERGWVLFEDDMQDDARVIRKDLQRPTFGIRAVYLGEALKEIIDSSH